MFTTPLVPSLHTLNIPDAPEDRDVAVKLWRDLFYKAQRYAEGVDFNLAKATHYNPEYFLADWSHTILDKDDAFRRDVLGWALKSLRTEQESIAPLDDAKTPDPENNLRGRCLVTVADMLKESRCLDRFKEWAEARRAYHCAALQQTFYNDDKLASKEPLASNVERLRVRFADWRDVRLREQEQLFHSDPKLKSALRSLKGDRVLGNDPLRNELLRDKEGLRAVLFRRFLEESGLSSGAISGKTDRIDYLCWLYLISPISEQWELHEIGLAILKRFPGESFTNAVKAWWENSPNASSLHYEPVEDTDGFIQRFKKAFPEEFNEKQADWLAECLEGLEGFTDKLRKQLQHVGFPYRSKRGKPRGKTLLLDWEGQHLTPDEVRRMFLRALRSETLASTKEDLENDEPKGWLLARSLRV